VSVGRTAPDGSLPETSQVTPLIALPVVAFADVSPFPDPPPQPATASASSAIGIAPVLIAQRLWRGNWFRRGRFIGSNQVPPAATLAARS
jgi:hypothetical protein